MQINKLLTKYARTVSSGLQKWLKVDGQL